MMGAILLLWALCTGTGHAQSPAQELAEPEASGGVLPGGKDPIEAVEDELEENKSDEQKKKEAAQAAFDEAQKAKLARVVVLQWGGTDTDYTNEALQRNVRNRIARPDAKFFPDVDMYNAGRLEPDPTVRPVDQRASPPTENIAPVLSLVEDTAAIPFNGMREQDWLIRADELRRLGQNLWFVDRAELREPVFLLYAQIGKAAENANQGTAPYYASIDNKAVNYFWYLAACMAHEDPALLSKISDQELYQNINNYKDRIDAGEFKPLTLSFDLNNTFDGRAFAGEYELYINGIKEDIVSPDGLYEVPLGITDVYLKRIDGGYSLSARFERQTADKGFEFPRQDAQKRMGLDLIDQLMENPSECIPELDGDIVNYLAIYAKLHPEAEIYVAVPQFGSTSPGRIFLWRWDRSQGVLKLVEDNTGGFPVRFAAIIGGGVAFSGASFTPPDDEKLQEELGGAPPGTEGVDPKEKAAALAPEFTPTMDGLPLYYQLRGHFNRIMMGVGMEFKVGTTGQDYYDFFPTSNDGKALDVVNLNGEDPAKVEFRQRSMQRLVYGLAGVMLSKDAAIGFGPRGYVRVGYINAPLAVDTTLHLGYTAKGPAGEKDEERRGRVRALLDVDGFIGAQLPYRESAFKNDDGFMSVGKPILTFGLTAGVGLTF